MYRVESICKHFGVCGGCQFQDMDYKEQLVKKQRFLKEIFKEFEIDEFCEIISSPEIWYYRNKMEFVVGKDKTQKIVAGLRESGKFYRIVDLQECKISSKCVGDILRVLKDWIKDNNLEPYDLVTHKGKVRYVVVKQSKTHNKIMLNFVVSGSKYQFENNEREVIDDLVKRYKNFQDISSVYFSINNSVSDNAVAEDVIHIYGDKNLIELINGISYIIYPTTFFQTNTKCCEKLYEIVTNEIVEGNTLDLYCGSGGISLQVVNKLNYGKVIGIDSSKENIAIAYENLELNSISNDVLEFICDNVENFILKLWKSKFMSNLSNIIVDPPRAGLSKKVKNILNEIISNRIIYVSCNPKTLYEDLKSLIKYYKIKKLIPVDMFPHTLHIELICVLEHR
ncbi:MAG: 23S rRNA (uracil(1939)-C(5))-methyltransferase RlmD [Endomicrobia bacterium]|nr:23S rRNA (uracil(1939)-C(5))-methyltransferase RlmD [Endomicrobiia bacterium]